MFGEILPQCYESRRGLTGWEYSMTSPMCIYPINDNGCNLLGYFKVFLVLVYSYISY